MCILTGFVRGTLRKGPTEGFSEGENEGCDLLLAISLLPNTSLMQKPNAF